jgi:hypothetical protein
LQASCDSWWNIIIARLGTSYSFMLAWCGVTTGKVVDLLSCMFRTMHHLQVLMQWGQKNQESPLTSDAPRDPSSPGIMATLDQQAITGSSGWGLWSAAMAAATLACGADGTAEQGEEHPSMKAHLENVVVVLMWPLIVPVPQHSIH